MLSRVAGKTEDEVLSGYDAVLHLVTCAKGAEFAYNLGNEARTESLEYAREMDDRTLRAWSGHPNLRVIDNSVNFEDKINRALREIYRILGQGEHTSEKRKYLIRMPDLEAVTARCSGVALDMMQTYLQQTKPDVERRIRQQKNGEDYLYFYTEKHQTADGDRWDTEKPISEKEYIRYLMEMDNSLHPVRKTKYRLTYQGIRMEIDVYPFDQEQAILFVYAGDEKPLPPEITVIREVTGEAAYKNRQLARTQKL